jgi:hypothetical protein
MSSNLQELDYLYNRIMVVELIKRTTNCSLDWEQTENVFQAEWTFEGLDYNVNLVRLPSGYVLDFIRDGEVTFSTTTIVDETIWELVRLVDNPNSPIRESLTGLRSQRGCESIFNEVGTGGVEVAGRPRPSLRINVHDPDLLGGLEAAGDSPNKSGFFAQGGQFLGGTATNWGYFFRKGRGGVVTRGGVELPWLYTMGATYIAEVDNWKYALFSFDTTGSQIKKFSEVFYGQLNEVTHWDVDYIDTGNVYVGRNSNVGITVQRMNPNFTSPVTIFSFSGAQAGGTSPQMRYDRFDNRIWYNFVDCYRYNFTGSPVKYDDNANHPGLVANDTIVFQDAIYTLWSGSKLVQYSKAGTQIASVSLNTQFNIFATSMAEDYANDVIWLAGQYLPIGSIGLPPPYNGVPFIGTISKDLSTFTPKYTNIDGRVRVWGVVIDNKNDGVFGYATTTPWPNSPPRLNIHKFRTDGSLSELSGSILLTSTTYPGGGSLRIWQKP